jgi:hypothetical protein
MTYLPVSCTALHDKHTVARKGAGMHGSSRRVTQTISFVRFGDDTVTPAEVIPFVPAVVALAKFAHDIWNKHRPKPSKDVNHPVIVTIVVTSKIIDSRPQTASIPLSDSRPVFTYSVTRSVTTQDLVPWLSTSPGTRSRRTTGTAAQRRPATRRSHGSGISTCASRSGSRLCARPFPTRSQTHQW